MSNVTTPIKDLTNDGTFLHSTKARLNKEINLKGKAFINVTNNLGMYISTSTINPTARQALFQAKVWVNRYWNSTTQECSMQVMELVTITSSKGHYEKPITRFTKTLDAEELSTPITDAEVLEEWEIEQQYQEHLDHQCYLFDDSEF